MGANILDKFREKDMDPYMKKMGLYTLDSGKTIWKMDMERWNFIIMTYIKEIGKTTWWMAKASTFTKMGIYLLEITLMTKEKDMENWFTLMEIYIRVSGKTICKMIWMPSFYILMEIFILASLRMVSFRELGKFRL